MPNKANLEALEKMLLARAKLSKCQSYVEFLANQALIQSYIAKGYKRSPFGKCCQNRA